MEFTQPDTIIPKAYSPQTWNRYSYTQNNPVRYNDPTGHDGSTPPDYLKFILDAINFFKNLGWDPVGDPTAKSLYANGADLVFNQGDQVLAVEVKNVSTNVDLGTLGRSLVGRYGGSTSQVLNSAERFANSSNGQLQQESQAILGAGDKLKNALYTNSGKVSQTAQDLFNGVYTNANENGATATKALPGAAVGLWQRIQTFAVGLSHMEIIPMFIIIDPCKFGPCPRNQTSNPHAKAI
jgi:hypothetical protein